MIYRLKAVKDTIHEETFGGYNTFPPNWEEIDELEFWRKMLGAFSWIRTEYRQMYPKDEHNKYMLNVGATTAQLYFWSDGTGVAVIMQVEKAQIAKPKFAKFARCKHSYRERNIGRCLHEYTCIHCGYRFTIDSSD